MVSDSGMRGRFGPSFTATDRDSPERLTSVFVYGEHFSIDMEPGQNAKAIAEWGNWIPGVLNLSALQGSQEDKMQIARIYRKLGLDNFYRGPKGMQVYSSFRRFWLKAN